MVRPCGNEQLDSALRNIMLEIFPWMCMKRSYLSGERVTFENAIQDSEYDSGSSEEEREWPEDKKEDSLDLNVINFLSRSVCTRSIRVISLSHQALASYQ